MVPTREEPALRFAGIGIRMAQELGLHVAAPRLSGTGKEKQLFNDDEQTVRRRLWFGCVKIDRYEARLCGTYSSREPIHQVPGNVHRWE